MALEFVKAKMNINTEVGLKGEVKEKTPTGVLNCRCNCIVVVRALTYMYTIYPIGQGYRHCLLTSKSGF